MKKTRIGTVVAAVAIVAGGLVAGGAPASADQEWFQAIPRATADTACPANTAEEDAAGWPAWEPSWAQWPGNGYGWWVCERTIDWNEGQSTVSPESTQALIDSTSTAHVMLGQPGYPVILTSGGNGGSAGWFGGSGGSGGWIIGGSGAGGAGGAGAIYVPADD